MPQLRKFPSRFKNLGQSWEHCYLCGQVYYPKSMLVKAHDGHWYCKRHYEWRFKKELMDEYKPKLEDYPDES